MCLFLGEKKKTTDILKQEVLPLYYSNSEEQIKCLSMNLSKPAYSILFAKTFINGRSVSNNIIGCITALKTSHLSTWISAARF